MRYRAQQHLIFADFSAKGYRPTVLKIRSKVGVKSQELAKTKNLYNAIHKSRAWFAYAVHVSKSRCFGTIRS